VGVLYHALEYLIKILRIFCFFLDPSRSITRGHSRGDAFLLEKIPPLKKCVGYGLKILDIV